MIIIGIWNGLFTADLYLKSVKKIMNQMSIIQNAFIVTALNLPVAEYCYCCDNEDNAESCG